MTSQNEILDRQTAIKHILGYLNYSSGNPDPVFLSSLNLVFAEVSSDDGSVPHWQTVFQWILEDLERYEKEDPAFRDSSQARKIISFVCDEFIPRYRQFHQILLQHRPDNELFTQFFVGRLLEAILYENAQEDSQLDFLTIRNRFDDYLGYRPVAVLESRKIEPYAHEFTRPIPLFIAGVGTAEGRYKPILDYALKLIRTAPAEILNAAQFDIDSLEEIAIDPRAYDFEHPVNKRPNYHFGQWDPHHLNPGGYYNRFIVQQIILDSLERRCNCDEHLRPEMVFESGAVLAGTILMASSICGRSPDSFDSETSIASLLPRIAGLRDHFYEWLLSNLEGKHGQRLWEEAREKRQPFGGARQQLNMDLALLREKQLETVRLSGIYAKMGYSEAAMEQAQAVDVASARLRTRMECLLVQAGRAIKAAEYASACDKLESVFDLLQQGIECGAMIDPWNILGFDAQFSLFPAMENSVQDDRAHYLVELMTHLLAGWSTLWSHVAAQDDQQLSSRVRERFDEVSNWWHKYAAHEVRNVDAPNGRELFQAAQQVANAMNLWHKSGSEAGNVAFWAEHAELFGEPRAYELIVNALLDREDFRTSMALLMHWLSQASTVGLETADSSFHLVVEQWVFRVCKLTLDQVRYQGLQKSNESLALLRKFMDFLEVNAEENWEVPRFELGSGGDSGKTGEPEAGEAQDADRDEIYGAAYEDVVYRDSTDDGVEGPVFETGNGQTDLLEMEAYRIEQRLRFHETVARIWEIVAPVFAECSGRQGELADSPESQTAASFGECVCQWAGVAHQKIQGLHRLIRSIQKFSPARGMGDQESVMEYDQQRYLQEGLLERVIMVTVDTWMAMRMLNAACTVVMDQKSWVRPWEESGAEASESSTLKLPLPLDSDAFPESSNETSTDDQEELGLRELAADRFTYDPNERLIADVFAAVLRNDIPGLESQIRLLLDRLRSQPLLYVPVSRGGDPLMVAIVKSRQLFIRRLLEILPRYGLIEQTFRLLNVARSMERAHPVGNGAVTEFDDLFEIGFRAVVESLIHSANRDNSTADQRQLLFRWLERFTESSLIVWLKHSQTLRLSVLEKIHAKPAWRSLVQFIKEYGEDIFTQRFLNFSNIRGILHQGIENWLQVCIENEQIDWKLTRHLGKQISYTEAVAHLSLILEAILENHLEYQDYNSTTTQSDRGEMLYMLIDFLRLKVGYERICWHLKPVFWAHEKLVDSGKDQVAKRWRRSLVERIRKKANRFVRNLERLQKRYAMKMPSVANRISEKFVKPMHIDRMKALVAPAMDPDNPKAADAFELLHQDAATLIQSPEGSGIRVPAWLTAIEDKVDSLLDQSITDGKILDLHVQPHPLPRIEVRAQLTRIAEITNRRRKRGSD